MRRTLPLAAALAALAFATPAAAQPDCTVGVTVASVEDVLPEGTRRVTLSPDMLHPFAELWAQAQEKRAALRGLDPDTTTLYARPDQPLMVAYSDSGCVLGVITIPRDRFWLLVEHGLGTVA